jgi:hypothetical protein
MFMSNFIHHLLNCLKQLIVFRILFQNLLATIKNFTKIYRKFKTNLIIICKVLLQYFRYNFFFTNILVKAEKLHAIN